MKVLNYWKTLLMIIYVIYIFKDFKSCPKDSIINKIYLKVITVSLILLLLVYC